MPKLSDLPLHNFWYKEVSHPMLRKFGKYCCSL